MLKMINKNNVKKIRINLLVVTSLMVVLLISFVSAFSVAFDSSKLQLSLGEEFESTFSLQNYGNSEDITVELTVEEGGDYISLSEGLQYDIKSESSAGVPVKFTVPETANIGDSFPVTILFKVISGAVGSEGGAGTVGFVINRRRTIEIEVVPKPGEEAPKSNLIWYILTGIIIVVIIIWFIVKKRKQDSVSAKSKAVKPVNISKPDGQAKK